MVSKIRDVLTEKPGALLLAVVGSSHKAYFVAYERDG